MVLRLGIVDFDTSHVVEFTKRLNHKGVPRTQWVDGAHVVVACPGESLLAPHRIAGFTAEMQQLGVPLVPCPTDLIGQVDGVLICSLEGGQHLARARPFLEAGLPCFIDKPFTCAVTEAHEIARLSALHSAPVFSSSALRYSPDVLHLLADERLGPLHGAICHGPAPLAESPDEVPRNPGLFHYGIHAVEMLYTVMGPGCVQVSCLHQEGADVVTGLWADGRLGTVRGLRHGQRDYGLVLFGAQQVRYRKVRTAPLYRELLRHVVHFFQTRHSPVPLEQTIEIIAFLAAALHSGNQPGVPVPLAQTDLTTPLQMPESVDHA